MSAIQIESPEERCSAQSTLVKKFIWRMWVVQKAENSFSQMNTSVGVITKVYPNLRKYVNQQHNMMTKQILTSLVFEAVNAVEECRGLIKAM